MHARGCLASIDLGVLSRRKAAERGGSSLLGKVAWIGGLVFTVAEVIVVLIYRLDELAALDVPQVPLSARSVT